MHFFKYFYQNTPTKGVFLTSIGIIFLITILRSIGGLQLLELTAYDFLFFLRPNEPIDDRVVIVAWDEADIQMTEEGTMSDNTLSILLERIKADKPRAIGLDIVRDVPVSSKSLSDEQNKQAYQRLVKIFESTPNLTGIEKVLPPLVDPPNSLKEKEQTSAGDLKEDVDGTIRRAFLFPQEDEKGNPAGVVGMGLALASKYLIDEGFSIVQVESNNAIIFISPQTKSEVILNPLEKLDGSYIKDEDGLLINVNWRKGEPSFLTVNVSDVATGNIPPDIFHDKIVLIGNTSASSSDKHRIPLNRWNSSRITNGVYIHAQIASSIISAAKDGRPLIKPIPEEVEIIILLLTVGGITIVAEKFRRFSPGTIVTMTAIGAFVIISGLTISSLIAFSFGYWIPIVPSLLGSLITPVSVILVIYISSIKQSNEENKRLLKKVQQTNKEYKLLIKDLNHTIQNSLNSIISNGKFAQSICSELCSTKNLPLLLAQLEEEFGERTATLLKNTIDALLIQTNELNRQRQNAQQYLNLALENNNVFPLESIPLNDFIQATTHRTISVKQSQYNLQVKLQENYDSQIQLAHINPKAFEKVIENLIDNAYYAIKDKINQSPSHSGILTIQTLLENKQIKIVVQDNGIGMSRELAEKIFIPFQSSRALNQGQGLGLSLASETMARHGGNITVETKEGEGSKFILDFPLHK